MADSGYLSTYYNLTFRATHKGRVQELLVDFWTSIGCAVTAESLNSVELRRNAADCTIELVGTPENGDWKRIPLQVLCQIQCLPTKTKVRIDLTSSDFAFPAFGGLTSATKPEIDELVEFVEAFLEEETGGTPRRNTKKRTDIDSQDGQDEELGSSN